MAGGLSVYQLGLVIGRGENTPPRPEMTASPPNPLPATGFRLGAPLWAAVVTGR
jgi:hypothetical protein